MAVEYDLEPAVFKKVKKLVTPDADDPKMVSCYPLSNLQIREIAHITGIQLDNDKYEFFLEPGWRLMEGERELTTGLLSKDANFRLIVSGTIGVREIERLIRKLQLDKEILADADDAATEEEQE